MPPSTDCSAATSCGGCRSYSGAVADGRLKSSATATDVPPSPCRRARTTTPWGSREIGGRRRTEHVFGYCYRRAPTFPARPAAAEEDVRKPEGAASNTRVHADLHNLWTSRWMEACRHVERSGDTADVTRRLPARHLREGRPPAVDGRNLSTNFGAPHHESQASARRHGDRRDAEADRRSQVTRGRTRAAAGQRPQRAPRRREGRRTAVRRPSRADSAERQLSRGRPRWSAGCSPRGARAR